MTSRSPLRLIWWSAAGVLAVAMLYMVMVLVPAGQLLDDTAMEGRKATLLAARRAAAAAVRVSTPAALVVVGSVVVATAFKLRGLLAASVGAAAILGTVAAGRLLKSLLPRSDLVPNSWVSSTNTFPGGHTGAVTILVLVTVTVCPPKRRPTVSAVGAALLVMHLVAVAGSGWHRMSDLVAAMALAVAFSGIANVLIVGSWREEAQCVDRSWYDDRRGVFRGVVVSAVAVLGWYVPTRVFVRGFAGSAGSGGFLLHVLLSFGACATAVAVVAVNAHLVSCADVGAISSGEYADAGPISHLETGNRSRPR